MDSDPDRTLIIDYGKGYSVISALSVILGPDRMDHILRGVYQTQGGDRIDLFEFRTICERACGADLEWFFDQWIRTNSFLSYDLDDVESEFVGGRYITTAEIVRTGSIRMPIPIAAYFEDGTMQTKYTNRNLDTDIVTFESISQLREIRLDPDDRLPMLKSENKKRES
jgi:aminopeptidase N